MTSLSGVLRVHAARFRRNLPWGVALGGCALLSGCGAAIPTFDDDPRPEICGGAVCFPPRSVVIRRLDGDELRLLAYRGELESCAVPSFAPVPVEGRVLEVVVRGPLVGVKIPLVPRGRPELPDRHAMARAVRIGSEGEPIADEEAVSGTAEILAIDLPSGRVRIRLAARWSSGVRREVELEATTDTQCH